MAADNPYNLNAGMKCVKYMLIIINFMFLVSPIAYLKTNAGELPMN